MSRCTCETVRSLANSGGVNWGVTEVVSAVKNPSQLEDTEASHDERIIAVREEPNLHIVCYERDVPDGMRKLTSLRGPTAFSLHSPCSISLDVVFHPDTFSVDDLAHLLHSSSCLSNKSSAWHAHNGSHLLILPVLIRSRTTTRKLASLIA